MPAYPPNVPPQYSVSPASQDQPPKKRVVWLVAVIVVILVLLVGSGAFYYFQTRPTPGRTLEALCNAWKAGNKQAMEEQFLPSDSKIMVTTLNATGYPPKDCTVSNVRVNGSSATGTMTVTATLSPNHYLQPYTLKPNLAQQSDGTWKITGFDTTLSA
jgi:hypothetical protein